jgi:hypothetical protein
MPDFKRLLQMLDSPSASKRYEACEELRVAASIPDEAVAALARALQDPDPNVADAARRALALHSPPAPPKAADAPPPPHMQWAQQPMPSLPANSPEYVFALEKRVMTLEAEVRRLSASVTEASALSSNAIAKLPNTAIVSPSFLSRAFAVWGHYFVAQLLIAIPIYCIFFLLIGMGGNY